MTDTKTYSNRSNAQRAGKAALPEGSVAGVHYTTREVAPDKWVWELTDTGRHVEDSMAQAAQTPAAPVAPAALSAGRGKTVRRGVLVESDDEAVTAVGIRDLTPESHPTAKANADSWRKASGGPVAKPRARRKPPQAKATPAPAQAAPADCGGSGGLAAVGSALGHVLESVGDAVVKVLTPGDKEESPPPFTRYTTSEKIAATASPPAPAAPAVRKNAKLEAVMEAARQGKLPTPPDFTSTTHKPFRKRLEAIQAMVAAGDVAGLEADDTKPVSSSRVMLCRYRDAAIVALKARKA